MRFLTRSVSSVGPVKNDRDRLATDVEGIGPGWVLKMLRERISIRCAGASHGSLGHSLQRSPLPRHLPAFEHRHVGGEGKGEGTQVVSYNELTIPKCSA